jgi:iron complex outermembrane recepter protein
MVTHLLDRSLCSITRLGTLVRSRLFRGIRLTSPALLALAGLLWIEGAASAQGSPPTPPGPSALNTPASSAAPSGQDAASPAPILVAPGDGGADAPPQAPDAAPPASDAGSAVPSPAVGAPAAAPQIEAPTEAQQLGAVVVVGNKLGTSDVAADKLNTVSGGTNLIRSDELTKGTVGTVGDVLNGQPGIYAQSVNGGEATRLSIRGSGIVRSGFLFGWGVVQNLDGQRLYGASGNPYEAIEPLAVDHVEVYRGANAFDYGPLSLGGTINYVTKTGYDAAPFQARLEGGSYGYFHEQISSGQVLGPLDYYLSVARFDKDGYRRNTESYSTRLVADVGYQLSPRLTTRVFFRTVDQYQEDAGFLTSRQLASDPRQSQFGTQIHDRVNPGTIVIGDTTTLDLPHGASLDAGLQYDDSPINSPQNGLTSVYFVFKQLAGSLRYNRADNIVGHQSNTLFAFYGHETLDNLWSSYILAPAQVAAIRPASQSDFTFVASNDTEVFHHAWLNLGVAGIFQRRYTGVSEGQGLVGQYIGLDYKNVVPKVAARYELTPRTSVFANVSGTVDTPSANSLIRTSATYVPLQFLPLKEAKATTIEVGTRGSESIFAWNLSAYRGWVTNELLTVQVAPTVTTSSNATPTIHQGVEGNLDILLWKYTGDGGRPGGAPRQQLVLRQTYTWNDFRFRNDPTFGTNRLAGVPIHLYQAQIAYEHSAGFYAGVSTAASFADYPGDFGNTIFDKKYAILGARAGFQQPKKGLEIFVEGRNLLNTKYAPVVAPIYNANGVDSAVYAPGEGIVIDAGLSLRF